MNLMVGATENAGPEKCTTWKMANNHGWKKIELFCFYMSIISSNNNVA